MSLQLGSLLPSLDGGTEWLNPLENKIGFDGPIFIHFWSLSCDSCRATLQEVGDLFRAFRDDTSCLSIHMPRNGDDQNLYEVRAVAAKAGITVPLCMDGNQDIANTFGIRFMPAYFIFDKEQELRYKQQGSTSISTLRRRLGRLQ
ncbi:thiol-disulfide isomerase/thioredoxin [Geomicrobium halophilum]|uniref:Thiol-disulfide isomerase/thioredoxin n=1 Tax=Geomicrobium halophilum TaxID=549000 RepID=A0A841PNT6_9BACL|nr:TlpA disulfide reductase family protein [Geomicrobium halophilum]MBB6449454.1 thiol-disulfide isomerase/thioredoxin [Geomicrobium halophilum]